MARRRRNCRCPDAAALVALVAASQRGLALDWQIAPAALTGLSVPLVGPLSRSRWVRLAAGEPELTSAMLSLDGIVTTASLPVRWGLPPRLRAGTVLLFAASCVLLFADGSLPALSAAVGFLGGAVAPQMITMFGLVERTVPAARLGEAMAALVSALILAQSAGTFLGGWAAGRFTPGAPFAVTSAAAATALVLTACTATDRRYRRRHAPPRTPAPAKAASPSA